MNSKRYFFRPRVFPKEYAEGFRGYRSLVVGAGFPCTIADKMKCRFKQVCAQDTAACDTQCPCYTGMSDQNYYRLSNSCHIEVDSFVEGERAPTYSFFTKYMTGHNDTVTLEEREKFWNSVAFYNYHQSVHVIDYDNTDIPFVPDDERNFNAFMDVLEELKPEVIYVWYKSVRDIIAGRKIPGLVEVAGFNANSISVYRFLYNVKSKAVPAKILSYFGNVIHPGENPDAQTLTAELAASLKAARNFGEPCASDVFVSDEMINFASKHCWDAKLTEYLAQKSVSGSGLLPVVKFIKSEYDVSDAASTFYLGNPDNAEIDGYVPCGHASFSFGTPVKTGRNMSLEHALSVFYLNEFTGLIKLNDIFACKPAAGTKILTIFRKENSAIFENVMLDSRRIGRISNFGHWICVEIEAEMQDSLRLSDGEVSVSASANVLKKFDSGKKLDVREYLRLKKNLDGCREYLEILESNGYINRSGEDEYSVAENRSFKIKVRIGNGALMDVSVFGGALKGAVYMYLTKECKIQQKDIKLIFPNETRLIADVIRDYKEVCKTGDDEKLDAEEIQKRNIGYLKSTFK